MIWRKDVMVSVGVVCVSLVLTVPSHRNIDRHQFVGYKKVYIQSASIEGLMGASVTMLEQRFVLHCIGIY